MPYRLNARAISSAGPLSRAFDVLLEPAKVDAAVAARPSKVLHTGRIGVSGFLISCHCRAIYARRAGPGQVGDILEREDRTTGAAFEVPNCAPVAVDRLIEVGSAFEPSKIFVAVRPSHQWRNTARGDRPAGDRIGTRIRA
jgi:hypothetical protein